MKISVITVCYNAVSRIERTVKSVLSQDFADYEYIVVDGASNDGTMDVVRKYAAGMKHVVSEPDRGIYDAMNKGVNLSTGEFCIFMNAGDLFYDSSVLSKVSAFLDPSISIVMGNQIDVHADGSYSRYMKTWNEVTAERLLFDSLYHQASFIRRADLKDTPYDETLRMVSDWKEAIQLLLVQKKRYLGIDIDVSIFYEDGLTTTMADLRIAENGVVWKEFFSDSFIETCQNRRREYKRIWNIKRYIFHTRDMFVQWLYRIKYTGILRNRLSEL